MNTIFRKTSLIRKISLVGVAWVLAVGVGCGKIPREYRGTYTGTEIVGGVPKTVSLTLNKNSGIFQADGLLLNTKSKSSMFDELSRGEPGIFLQAAEENPGKLTFRWIRPDSYPTRQEEAGLLWFQGAMVQALLDPERKEPTQSLEILICPVAEVTLNTSVKGIQAGCKSGGHNVVMKRIVEG